MHGVDAVKRLLEQLKADLLEREGAVMTGGGEDAFEDFYRRVRSLYYGYEELPLEEAQRRLDELKDEWAYSWEPECQRYPSYLCPWIERALTEIDAALRRGEAGTKECGGVSWAVGVIMDKLIARVGGYENSPEGAWDWAATEAHRHGSELEQYYRELKSQGLPCADIWARLDSRAETIADGIMIPEEYRGS